MATLKTLVNDYFTANEQKKVFTATTKEIGNKIKALMKAQGVQEIETNTAKATVTYRTDTSIDEDALIQVLKDANIPQTVRKSILKTRVYIDEEQLEKAIYLGIIPQETIEKMAECEVTKTTQVLTVKAVKK